MKRVLLSITATVLGLVALLSFKSHGHPVLAAGGLPAASVPSATSSASAGSRPATSTSAPPKPGRTKAGRSSASTAAKQIVGSAVQTPYGVVQVAVTVSGTHIDKVSFVQLTAFDGRSQEINSAAAPILLQETLSAQNAHIDSVSGASYTSAGYVDSLQSALDQVGIR